MSNKEAPDFVQLTMLNDQSTPHEFVVDLLEDVFGRTAAEAKVIATHAHHFGEADCGVWPRLVAEALLEAASVRIREEGHPLAFARSGRKRDEVFGQSQCALCGKPEAHAGSMYQDAGLSICDACVLEAAGELSSKVGDGRFQYAHEILSWHFGGTGLSDLVTSVRTFPMRMRADLQLAFDQVFSARAIRQIGIKSGSRYQTVEFADLWEDGRAAQAIVPVQYTEVDIGEEQPRRCVGTALWLLDDAGVKHCVLVSQDEGPGGNPAVRLEVAVPEGQVGAEITARYFREIEKVIDQAQSYRGKVLSLEVQNRWQGLAGGITIHRLPRVERQDVILPEKTLALLDRNVLRFADLRTRLREIGQQSKKGLLFYGPPGTGKTHTIQYLASNLAGHTTLLVTAEQVCLLHEYLGLARLLQPSILVIEDADLIARDREEMSSPAEEALLNKLLNEMDGLREDSDIFFILTTNRPEHLEAALAGRPGRIDQAIEFPLPDEDGRQKLADLYKGNLEIDDVVLRKIVERTEGVSGAFMKELMRRISQQVFESGPTAQRVTEAHIVAALDEMMFEGGTLNARLLGVGPPPE